MDGLSQFMRSDMNESISASSSSIGLLEDISDYSQAFYLSMWSYDGWQAMAYAVEEMKNPERSLRRRLHNAHAFSTFQHFNISTFQRFHQRGLRWREWWELARCGENWREVTTSSARWRSRGARPDLAVSGPGPRPSLQRYGARTAWARCSN